MKARHQNELNRRSRINGWGQAQPHGAESNRLDLEVGPAYLCATKFPNGMTLHNQCLRVIQEVNVETDCTAKWVQKELTSIMTSTWAWRHLTQKSSLDVKQAAILSVAKVSAFRFRIEAVLLIENTTA